MDPSRTGPAHVGVGIDTARYGHHVTFVGEDRQEAAKDFTFLESRQGYAQLEAALRHISERFQGAVHFDIRIDAAGQYAENVEAFLRRLEVPKTVSVGEPKRNRDYKNAHYPKRKADEVDSRACARFAAVERPAASAEVAAAMRRLREACSALISQRKQTTGRINRLHNVLSRVFPELAVLTKDLSAQWVLKLLAKYPSPARIAAAQRRSLVAMAHIDAERAEQLQSAAQTTVASLDGAIAEDLVRHAVEELRHSQRAERRMENLLEAAYDALGPGGHRQVKTIPGIGMRTAAALAAKIVDVDRFSTPEQLVNYFGTFPEEHTSGVDRRGNKVTKGTMLMSVKGNDLVRGHLWMASPRAYSTTPHFAPCMLASGRWAKVAGDAFAESGHRGRLSPGNPFFTGGQPTEQLGAALPQQGRRAVANPFAFSWRPIRPRRRAATGCSRQLGHRAWVDFAHVRAQITMEQVLSRLGVYDRLRGSGPQKRGPCPIHHSRQGSARPFCVHLGKSVFRCLNPSCAAHGNVLDLWAAVRGMELREAAIDLAQTFHLQLAATPKRRR